MGRSEAIGSGRTRVLVALLRHEATVGAPPSVRDIANAAGMAFPTVHAHLTRLRKMGLVAWEDGHAKTLRSSVAIVVTKAVA